MRLERGCALKYETSFQICNLSCHEGSLMWGDSVATRYLASHGKKEETQIICKLFVFKKSIKQIFAVNYLIKFANIWSTGIFSGPMAAAYHRESCRCSRVSQLMQLLFLLQFFYCCVHRKVHQSIVRSINPSSGPSLHRYVHQSIKTSEVIGSEANRWSCRLISWQLRPYTITLTWTFFISK